MASTRDCKFTFTGAYLWGYNKRLEIRQTDEYARWFKRLRDREARARILVRIRRLSLEQTLVVLLAGGDKGTRSRDVEKAKELARGL